jgi:molecular chaperone GrpE (heat shock protein)
VTRAPRFPFLIVKGGDKTMAKETKRAGPSAPLGTGAAGPGGDPQRVLLDKLDVIEQAAAAFLKREKSERGIEDFFTRLIPVLDALEAMRSAVAESGEPEWKRGIDLFCEKLFDLFSSFEFAAAAEIGERFDPARHRAVGTDERADAPEGIVTRVVRSGWTYRSRLLRAADVVVSRKA